MSKRFYTDIYQSGNNIHFRGYENGLPIQEKIEYSPFIYIKGNGEYSTQSGLSLSKKSFETISDYRGYLENFRSVENHSIFGARDIVTQYIHSEFKDGVEFDDSLIQCWFFDIETKVGENSKGFPFPETALEEILLITMYNHTQKKGYIFSTKEINIKNKVFSEGADFRSYSTEAEMLKEFVLFFASNRIDILSGWNSEMFDIPYLVNRIRNVHGTAIANMLSPWKKIHSRKVNISATEERETFDIKGIVHLDYMELYKKFNPSSKESFKLDFIADLELGCGKVENPYESFKEFYTSDFDLFTEYNWTDVTLLCRMEDKLLQLKLAMMLSYMAKVNIGDVMSSMRLWESIIYGYFNEKKIAQPMFPTQVEPRHVPGAYVHTPKTGKYKWVVSVDATSLYPSIMMQNNISPETKMGMIDLTPEDILNGNLPTDVDTSKYIISGNGLITHKEFEGYIPYLVKQQFESRKKFKKQMLEYSKELEEIKAELKKENNKIPAEDLKNRMEFLDSNIRSLDLKQKVVKVLAYSLYGITANKYFSGYDPDLAEGITLTGQVAIRKTQEIINTFLNKALETDDNDYCFYGDTDSAYICLEKLVELKCKGKTDLEIVNYIEKFVFEVIQPVVNKNLGKLMDKLGVEDCKLEFKLECIGPALAMSAKKRYAFDILYSEGVRYQEPKTKVMGMEIVRSSTPSVIKGDLKKSVEIILRKDEVDIQKFIKSVKSTFMEHHYKDIAFPRGCNGLEQYSDSASIYKSGTPIHVRAALLHNFYVKKLGLEDKYPLIGDGDKIKFISLKVPNPIHENVIGFIGTIPPEFGLESYIDYNTQYEKSYLKPMDTLMKALDWSIEEKLDIESLMGCDDSDTVTQVILPQNKFKKKTATVSLEDMC